MSLVAQKFASILGSTAVSSWEDLDAGLKVQFAQALVPQSQVDCVVYPATQAELAEVMPCAHLNRWRVLPCGNGSKLHWGGLAEGIQVGVSTARMNRLIEHAVGDLTVTAEAGMRLSDLQAVLVKEGQFLSIDPAYPELATLGGIVATADTGSLRQRYGGIRDLLIGISFVRSDGKSAKAGGRVVKNVAGYDLMKLLTGSYGTLGIISQVTFRIYPLPSASQTVILTGSKDAIAQATKTILASALTPTALDILSPTAIAALGLGEGMGLISRFQSIDVSVAQQIEQVSQVGRAIGLQVDCLTGADETALWQQLREQMEVQTGNYPITCKIGVLPSRAAETLAKIDSLVASPSLGQIHAASGLGILRLRDGSIAPQTLLNLRNLCQAESGFLTIREAPAALKQRLDVWGYAGNALDVMQKIKSQFDPENLLSPCRFVGGI